MKLLIFFTLAVCSAAIHAQGISFPQYFEVSGIASNDSLNVRSGPTIRHRVVGNLKPDSGTLEILEISDDNKWGRILWADSNGWVSADYLREVSPTKLKNTMVPVGLHCSGTEPYWDFAINSQADVTFKELFTDSIENSIIESVAESDNNLNFPTALLASSDKVKLTVMLNTRQCNDGLTERAYGWEIDILVTHDAKQRLLSGCCSM